MHVTRMIWIALGVPWILFATSAYAQLPATAEHQAIMERKLFSAQQVLDGIAREDFAVIKKHAQTLNLLSQEAGWNVLLTPEYMRLSDSFRCNTTQLEKAADEKNVDAVGLAFVKLSISCIDCHRHARSELARIGKRLPRAKPSLGLR